MIVEFSSEVPTEMVPAWPTAKAAAKLCSANSCQNGHEWPVMMAVEECPGCKQQMLVVLMENCPVCNEPTKEWRFRTDHVFRGGGVVSRCLGQENAAEVVEIRLERQHAKEAEVEEDPVEEHKRRTAAKEQQAA